MAMTSTERVQRFREKVRDPAEQRAIVLAELYECAMGRRPATPSKLRAIELWLELHGGVPPRAIALGKKVAAMLRAQQAPPPDSPWAGLIDPETEH